MTINLEKEIKEHLQLQPNEQLLIQDRSSKAPLQISGIQFFESQHELERDPVAYNYWILVDEKNLYRGESMLKILKEKKLFPKNKEEALNYAKLIIFARGDVVHSSKENNVSEPVVNEREDYFEVVLSVLENPKLKNTQLVKYIFKLGKGIYQMSEEDNSFD